MKMRLRITVPSINIQAYRQALVESMFDSMLRGVFAYLDAVTSVVPEWSGASRATFLHLARQVGYPLVVNNLPHVENRVPLGLAESEGSFKSEEDKGRVSFKYKTTLPHLVYNEYNNANDNPDPTLFGKLRNPGPYGLQELGKQAFIREVRTALPDINGFIILKTVEAK